MASWIHLLSLKDNCPTKYNLKTNLRQLFPPSFKSTMKSSIIKAVTQTQFETCVTAFIALLLNDGGKSCLKLVLRLYLVGQLSFNDSNVGKLYIFWRCSNHISFDFISYAIRFGKIDREWCVQVKGPRSIVQYIKAIILFIFGLYV